jgi:small subunit ribosomal protein S4e
MTHQKRLPAPKHYPIQRKQNTYVSTIKGSRSSDNAVPAVLVLRDILEYADTEKEAKQIVKNGDLLRNGDPIRDIKEGIGILDVIEIPETEEVYRVIRKGKYLEFVDVEDSEKTAGKVVGKSVEGEEFVYRLHNGENYRTKDEFNTGSTLVFNGGVEEFKLEEDTEVLVIEGKHAGETAELTKITKRGMNSNVGRVKKNGHEFETRLENLVAIGDLEVE